MSDQPGDNTDDSIPEAPTDSNEAVEMTASACSLYRRFGRTAIGSRNAKRPSTGRIARPMGNLSEVM